LEVILADSMAERRFVMLSTLLFALTALILAIVGVHGGVSRRLSDRRVELGIRTALGARAGSLRWLVVRGELIALIGGIALGAASAYLIARFVDGTPYGVNPRSPVVYALTALFLCATGLLAIATSTWKLSRIDIVRVLRR
jgi:ABC-type antimicrobial peptide transport system permease subunit